MNIMKTSNKILLGIFLAIILLSATINLMVYAKYKRGDYVPFVREEEHLTSVNLPAAKYVSIVALCHVELTNGATPGFQVRQGQEKGITYRMVGDTLVILGYANLSGEIEQGECNSQLLKLHLPATTEVYAHYAGIRLNGKADSTQAPSYNIHLDKRSVLRIENNDDDNRYINQLLLSGDNTYIELDEHIIVSNLSLKMVNNSRFDDRKGEIRKLTLDVDNNSTINLSGNSIKNLK
jgi:hypothetical protein